MATKHWVRDVPFTDPANYIANGNHMQGNAVLYNFLKVAGWEQVWECDGERTQIENPSHVEDGNVQSAGTTYWSSYNGATVSKDTTKIHSGIRSLKVEAANPTEGVITAALLSMRNPSSWTSGNGDSLSGPVGREMTYTDNTSRFAPSHVGDDLAIAGNGDPNNDGVFPITQYLSGTSIRFENPLGSPTTYYVGPPTPPPDNIASFQRRPRYEIDVWAATDVAFDVEVDLGTGSYTTVGTIPANGGVFTRYSFNFSRTGTGNTTIRFKSAASGTLYIGGLNVFSSMWDKPSVIKRGTDGVLTNPDRFSTAGSFTPDLTDVGKILFIWDPTNNKNSGAYPIIQDLGGGVVQLDLRSASAALTSANGLRWRIARVDYLEYPNYGIEDKLSWAGFGFESVHTSGWRFFLRQSQENGQTGKGSIMWSAPEDTDFDFSTGQFYKSGPSVQRNRQGPWVKIPDSAAAPDEHLWRGGYSYKTSPHDSRCFIMTDEDGAFFNFFLWDEDGDHGCHLHGYLGSTLPGVESHYLFSRWEQRGVANECYFDSSGNRFGRDGTTYDAAGLAVPCTIAQLGYAGSSDDVELQSNAGPNPWSGDEWKRPLILWRDNDANKQAMALQISNVGIYQGRQNMVELSTFDSENLLHLDNGYIWEWSGETIL
jgi:hypothetical protein